MTKTKQTACGGSSSRPAGMVTARFGDEAGDSQFEDIPEEEWPDMDKPPLAAEVGETSKLAGKEGDQPTPRPKLKKELLHLLQTTPLTIPKNPKQVLAQMAQVSRSM